MDPAMDVIPAIDIRGGRCVRLVQGDYARETVFADDPAEAARRWRDAGAKWLHVVDLDGAREGRGGPGRPGVTPRSRYWRTLLTFFISSS